MIKVHVLDDGTKPFQVYGRARIRDKSVKVYVGTFATQRDAEAAVKEVVAGDTVSEVLAFVDYSPSDLLRRLRNNVESALRRKLLTIEESRQLINRFRQGMIGYTYLDRE